MTNGQILQEAQELINGDRTTDYGSPAENFRKIADMWTTYLGHAISPKDAAICMVLLKLCRETVKEKRDNLLDAAGYIGIADDLTLRPKASKDPVKPETWI